MIIKEADEKRSQIAALEELGARREASADVRKRIEKEIWNIRSGIKGEEEAAYEINFHFGASKNDAVLHDLRLECEGRVAQIDHLVIGRFLDMWVCETKNFCEGMSRFLAKSAISAVSGMGRRKRSQRPTCSAGVN